MRVLTIGGGGRESAAVDAFHRAGSDIYAVMKNSNPGIIEKAKKYLLTDEKNIAEICRFAKENIIELAFVGPEAPLEAGLVDALEEEGVPCASPTRAAARIETSKSFMRELVRKHKVDGNLEYAAFDNPADTETYLKKVDHEIVVKPVGLTGGKGVKVQGEHIHTMKDIMGYVNEIFENNIGGAGVIIEEKAVGEEFTQMAFCDGKTVAPMPLVQDHKRAYEGDVGPNTGGMGSYSDADHLLPFVGVEDRRKALDIMKQIVSAMSEEGCPYRGVMYGQFMLTKSGPKIIEINARFGDPEAMNVLPILEDNFEKICWDMAKGTLSGAVRFAKKATVCKYVVPRGYGTKPEAGHRISVDMEGVKRSGAEAFYSNVDMRDGVLVTGTSRAVGVVGIDDSLEGADWNCETALSFVESDAIFVRHDIGTRDLIQRRVDHMREILGK